MHPKWHGILLLSTAVALFAGVDAMTKFLRADYGALQMLFIAMSFSLIPVTLQGLKTQGRALFHLRRRRLMAVQVLLGAGSQLLVYWSLKSLPLALFSVIAFTSPLFLILFSWCLLGEKIGPRRAAAVALGFLGVVLAYLPEMQGLDASELNLAALAALAASLTYALVLITINRMEEEGTGTLGFYNTFGHVVLLWPVLLLDWQPVAGGDWFWFAALGITTGTGWVMTVHAYRIAAASLLASYEYLYLVWAGIFGFVFFDELLGPAFWLAALLIVGSGLYLARREHIESAALHRAGEIRVGRKQGEARDGGSERPG
ncbi:MAG: DMT family transporter [Rhodovibrionaceae bacterium]